MSLLSTLAHHYGKTIITSIHQPSSAMFHNFDKVLFLADGCAVYNGSPSESLSYMKELGYACPDGYNAADHWMDLLVEDSAIPDNSVHHLRENSDQENKGNQERSDLNGTSTVKLSGNGINGGNHSAVVSNNNDRCSANSSKSIFSSLRSTRKEALSPVALAVQKRGGYANGTTSKARLITMWDIEVAAHEIEQDLENAMINEETCESSIGTNMDTEVVEKKFNTSWLTQFRVLLHRSMKNSRSAILTPLNLVKAVCLGTIVGLLWFQMEDTEKIVVDRAGYLFFSITFWIFEGTFSALFGFPSERTIIFKERSSGSYHLSAYFMAKTLSEMPTRLVLPCIFLTISYWMTAVSSSFATFVLTGLCTVLGVLSGESLGLLVGALVMDSEKALTVMVVYTLTSLVAGGFYIKNIPVFMAWAPYLSPFRYAYQSTATLVFDHPVPCDGSGTLEVICEKPGVEFATAEEIRDFLGIEHSVAFNIGMMFVIIVVARYLAFLALKSKRGGDRD